MIKTAIIEDDGKEAEELRCLIVRYCKEREETADVEICDNPLNFLENYKMKYDIVFVDIEMPLYNGMEMARKLREKDGVVIIVFVTHMAQYAAEGYSVDAMDFIVKPVKYPHFTAVMNKALRRMALRRGMTFAVNTVGGLNRVPVDEIMYIEVSRHRIFVHMLNGTVYDSWGNLGETESKLPANFARCNSCYLVNLDFVDKTEGDVAFVAGVPLKISRSRKKDFVARLVSYISGSGAR